MSRRGLLVITAAMLVLSGCGVVGLLSPAVGQIFVADSSNSRIVRINGMTGAGWTTFGSLGSGINQFNNPRAIVVNAAGQIFVADTDNHRIVRINDMTGGAGRPLAVLAVASTSSITRSASWSTPPGRSSWRMVATIASCGSTT